MTSFMPLVTQSGEIIYVNPFHVQIVGDPRPIVIGSTQIAIGGTAWIVKGNKNLVMLYLSGHEQATDDYEKKYVEPALGGTTPDGE